jgi:Protein of unknown function (DUF2846)
MNKNLFKLSVTFFALFASINLLAQNTSKIVVYRKSSLYGSLAKYQLNVDGKPMEKLKSNSVYSFDVAPGRHTISSKQRKRAISIDTEAGKTYAVKYSTAFGLLGGRPRLKEMTYEEANKDARSVRKM